MKNALLLMLMTPLSICGVGDSKAYCNASEQPIDSLAEAIVEDRPSDRIVISGEYVVRLNDTFCSGV